MMPRMLRRLFVAALALLGLLAVAAYLYLVRPMRLKHPAEPRAAGALIIRDARVYVSPDDAPLDHASILIRDGRIVEVGPAISAPSDARVLPCDHCIVTAGFWNAHVHFTEPHWSGAAYKSAAALTSLMQDMLTRRGFTTVVDVGSNPFDTVPLRRRVEAGEVLGPKIYTAGAAQYPPEGIPFYLRDSMPHFMLRLMPQPETAADAAHAEETNIDRGADVLKLFTGSYVERDSIKPMPLANAIAAVQVAHAHGQLAFAHPSSLAGVLVARDSGVDILAHAADDTDGVTPQVLQSLIDHHMSMVPTLKMFATTVTRKTSYLDPIYAEIHEFHSLGGELLFGTDVGYMTDYTTQDEFAALARSGLTWQDMLRMLTTAPAARFHVQADKGRVESGQLADLVILGSDPATRALNFADVRLTLRGGRILYQAPP